MRAIDLFPSAFFNASDFIEAPRVMTIEALSMGTMPDGVTKPALSFNGEQKKLVLNKTNASMIQSLHGNETDGWNGKQIELYADKTPMQGRIVDCMRVRMPQPRNEINTEKSDADDLQWNAGQ